MVNESVQRAAWDEIAATARVWQYDRYLAATLAPRAARDGLILIAAFAGDVDRILATVSEPAIAAIRLEWWRQAIACGEAQSTGNPLADMLCNAIHRQRLPQQKFFDYLDAQEVELYSDLLPDLAALKNHFVKREGSLFDLAFGVLAEPAAGEVRAAIASGAQAYGLARTIVQLPRRFNARQFLISAEIAERYSVKPGAGVAMECVQAIQGELVKTATADLAVYARHLQCVPRQARTALLPVAVTGLYLAAGRHGDAAKTFEVEPSNFARAWRMLRAHWRGRS